PTFMENQRPGTGHWRLSSVSLDDATGHGLRSVAIEGYASKTSLYPGESVDFHVSTSPAADFTIEVFRTGYYGGTGGRLMTRLGSFAGEAQPTPPSGEGRVRECAWPVSATLEVPGDWPSGVYLAKLTRADNGFQSYIIFVLKSREPAAILFQVSDLTWQSYNKWPGKDSLYDDGGERDRFNQYLYTGPDTRVSFDRPYAMYAQLQRVAEFIGSGSFLLTEFPLAYWLEKEGYHIAYCSNLDTLLDPSVLDRAKLFLSVAHDEYWAEGAFKNVAAARDRGMSMAFLSGNALLYEVPLQPSSVTGRPARVFGRGPRLREAGRGLMGATTYGSGNGDWIVRRADHWIFEGTGLRNGDAFPNLVGWEYHGPPYADIEGLEVIASASLFGYWGGRERQLQFGSVVFPGPRDSWVFNAGTIWWSQALAAPPGHVRAASHESRTIGVDDRVRRITRNFIQRALRGPEQTAAPRPATELDSEEFALVPAGSFIMGSPLDEPGRLPDESQVAVTLARPFHLGRTEVPWSLWNKVRDWARVNGYSDISPGRNGFNGPDGEDHPVVKVSWWDAVRWCNARSEMEGREPVYYSRADFDSGAVIRTGMPPIFANWHARGYRLPTEAEWEYACRAGTQTAFSTGPAAGPVDACLPDENLGAAGWHCANSEGNTHPARGRASNAFGLYDMHGNADEWCWDWFGPYDAARVLLDPTGPATGTQRILRGGNWMSVPAEARSAHRHALAPSTRFYSIGFRLAVTH
ncbi:MAG: formylglycine-generating enzyme family protein, partial [Puniceicoccaceae bacterium]